MLIYYQPRIPETNPRGLGHAHGVPGGPGGWAQHQKDGVKQIVPGGCGGTRPTCATAAFTMRQTARIHINITSTCCGFILSPVINAQLTLSARHSTCEYALAIAPFTVPRLCIAHENCPCSPWATPLIVNA
jgi:hypothetical protein